MTITFELIKTMAQGARPINREEMVATEIRDKIYIKIEKERDQITFWEYDYEIGWAAARISVAQSTKAKERLRALWMRQPNTL